MIDREDDVVKTLIGYRKVNSFQQSNGGVSDVELGDFCIWSYYHTKATGGLYRIWLNLSEMLPGPYPYTLDYCHNLALSKSDAEDIVLDHVKDALVCKRQLLKGSINQYTRRNCTFSRLHSHT